MHQHNDKSSERFERKRLFYDAIDSSTNSEDDTPDPGRQSSMQAMHKAATRTQAASKKKKESSSLPRSVSDSSLARKSKSTDDDNAPPRSTDPATAATGTGKLPASLLPRHTFSGGPSKPMSSTVPSSIEPKTTGKRKRSIDVAQVPDDRQVFKGLHFYFFPNTDKHPARKLRIAKALEYGAKWETDFNNGVTHVIVDKAMDFGLLLKFLKRENLPSKVVVVSENYPAECLSYKMLLDPKQLQFKVKGYEMPAALRPGSSASDKSLQLKPAGKAVVARQPETQTSAERAATPTATVSSDDEEEARYPPTNRPAITARSHRSNAESTEDFDAAIKQARELQDVPLDSDEGDSRPTSSEGPATDDEGQSTGPKLLKPKNNKFQNFQDRFQCMQKNTGQNDNNPNAPTIAILQQMADYYGQVGDEWRIRAYRKAMATLRNHPTKVKTKEEALALPQIGDRLATKIEEIAVTNRLRRLDNAKAEPSDQILQTFMGVYGAGYAQASKWVSAGYSSLDELLQKAELTENHRIGIEHYEDFHTRIPRVEVEQHGKIVRKTLQKIDSKFELILGGSYRRGSGSSGDIDCVITRPDTGIAHIRQIVLDQLIPKLFAKRFLVAELAATSRDDGSKWHGASRIPHTSPNTKPGPWRRIDLLLVPSDKIGAALIYFTGDDIFNRSLRLLASTKGMRLNQRGLYKDVIRGKGREKLSEGTLVEGKDEKRIFQILQVPWRPPEHRIC